MKIAILSMHRVINYGSALQAFSLKQMVEEITGEEVDFIDPIMENTMQVNMPVRDSDDYVAKDQYGIRILRDIRKAVDKVKYKKLKQVIVKFQKNELGINYEYDPHEQEYDLVIEGSDEVFKASDKIYLYMYGAIENTKKLITYAAACGSATYSGLNQENVEKLRVLMKKYSAMSVRDKHTYDYIKKLYQGGIEEHLDPVLVGKLFERKHNPVKLKNYMVVYAYGNRIRDKKEIEQIKKYARDKKLKTIAIGAPQFWCDKFLVVSPLEALDYFYYADCVVTDTFHGTIFSIINKCNFATILRKSNKNKLGNLLKQLDLEDRIVKNIEDISDIYDKKIDYQSINVFLKKEREKSKEYLKNQIKMTEKNT